MVNKYTQINVYFITSNCSIVFIREKSLGLYNNYLMMRSIPLKKDTKNRRQLEYGSKEHRLVKERGLTQLMTNL